MSEEGVDLGELVGKADTLAAAAKTPLFLPVTASALGMLPGVADW